MSDTQVPVFTNCPDDLLFFTDPLTRTAEVHWPEISATDNDGSTPSIVCDPQEGAALMPGYFLVTCVATDRSSNERRCHFQIEVRGEMWNPVNSFNITNQIKAYFLVWLLLDSPAVICFLLVLDLTKKKKVTATFKMYCSLRLLRSQTATWSTDHYVMNHYALLLLTYMWLTGIGFSPWVN